MSETVFTQSALSAMLIHQLRTLARDVGVDRPTTRPKQDLIDQILAIKEGRAKPQPQSRRGRPPIKQVDITSVGQETAVNQQDVEVFNEQVQIDEETPEETPEELILQKPQQPADTTPPADTETASAKDTVVSGILEILPEGYGFLRVENFHSSYGDVYVPPVQIRRFGLKTGDKIECKSRAFNEKQSPSLIFVFKINDVPCEEYVRKERFEDMVSCYPNERLTLEMDKNEYSLRLIDLVAPIGKGQRGLIVAAPKTGKTILLKKIAQAIRANHPEMHLIVLLIDERPEEVTDFKQSLDCDVAYSTFDQSPIHHIQIAELVISNAKRRVEQGQDVMILLDSITRLGRAYNQTAEQSGRTLTGGLDISALQEPKRFFGAGRNVVGKGSLTILATALIDTGSRLDDIVYEEFKGTGNMEIHLDRRMSEKRIFPAIDLAKSGTRREEMLLTQSQLEGMWMIRRALSRTDTIDATEQLIDLLMTTNNNAEFINLLKVLSKKPKK
ncbi:MAG: transcription termination factor Rho [Clostridia bacterium]